MQHKYFVHKNTKMLATVELVILNKDYENQYRVQFCDGSINTYFHSELEEYFLPVCPRVAEVLYGN